MPYATGEFGSLALNPFAAFNKSFVIFSSRPRETPSEMAYSMRLSRVIKRAARFRLK